MKASLKNHNKPTNSKIVKIGAACGAASAVIVGSGVLLEDKPVAYAGLVLGVASAVIPILYGEK
jgi:hypothetical protein